MPSLSRISIAIQISPNALNLDSRRVQPLPPGMPGAPVGSALGGAPAM